MPKALDLTNQKFGKLIALSKAPKRNDKYTRWLCQCDCGQQIEVRTDYLRNGHTTSCGCIKNNYFTANFQEKIKFFYWNSLKMPCKPLPKSMKSDKIYLYQKNRFY